MKPAACPCICQPCSFTLSRWKQQTLWHFKRGSLKMQLYGFGCGLWELTFILHKGILWWLNLITQTSLRHLEWMSSLFHELRDREVTSKHADMLHLDNILIITLGWSHSTYNHSCWRDEPQGSHRHLGQLLWNETEKARVSITPSHVCSNLTLLACPATPKCCTWLPVFAVHSLADSLPVWLNLHSGGSHTHKVTITWRASPQNNKPRQSCCIQAVLKFHPSRGQVMVRLQISTPPYESPSQPHL